MKHFLMILAIGTFSAFLAGTLETSFNIAGGVIWLLFGGPTILLSGILTTFYCQSLEKSHE